MLLFRSYDMIYILLRGDNWLKRKTTVAQKKSKWQQQQKPKSKKKNPPNYSGNNIENAPVIHLDIYTRLVKCISIVGHSIKIW